MVPFTQARANLSELAAQAKAGAEKIITKNGESRSRHSNLHLHLHLLGELFVTPHRGLSPPPNRRGNLLPACHVQI